MLRNLKFQFVAPNANRELRIDVGPSKDVGDFSQEYMKEHIGKPAHKFNLIEKFDQGASIEEMEDMRLNLSYQNQEIFLIGKGDVTIGLFLDASQMNWEIDAEWQTIESARLFVFKETEPIIDQWFKDGFLLKFHSQYELRIRTKTSPKLFDWRIKLSNGLDIYTLVEQDEVWRIQNQFNLEFEDIEDDPELMAYFQNEGKEAINMMKKRDPKIKRNFQWPSTKVDLLIKWLFKNLLKEKMKTMLAMIGCLLMDEGRDEEEESDLIFSALHVNEQIDKDMLIVGQSKERGIVAIYLNPQQVDWTNIEGEWDSLQGETLLVRIDPKQERIKEIEREGLQVRIDIDFNILIKKKGSEKEFDWKIAMGMGMNQYIFVKID